MEKNKTLQSLLNKIIAHQLMDNFDRELDKVGVSHSRLSKEAGKLIGAFNKLFNEGNDPKISTFLRFLYAFAVSKDGHPEDAGELYDIRRLISEELLEALKIANDIANAHIDEFIQQNKDFFIGLKAYIELPSGEQAFNKEELLLYKEIYEKLTSGKEEIK